MACAAGAYLPAAGCAERLYSPGPVRLQTTGTETVCDRRREQETKAGASPCHAAAVAQSRVEHRSVRAKSFGEGERNSACNTDTPRCHP